MNKSRLTVYLSHSVADRLAIACKRPGANKSKLACFGNSRTRIPVNPGQRFQ
jgi:hypothetical protein